MVVGFGFGVCVVGFLFGFAAAPQGKKKLPQSDRRKRAKKFAALPRGNRKASRKGIFILAYL